MKQLNLNQNLKKEDGTLDKRRRDNKDTPGNKPSLKPSKPKRKIRNITLKKMAKAKRTLYLWNLSIDKSIDQKENDLEAFFQVVIEKLKKSEYNSLNKRKYRDLFYGLSIKDGIIQGKVLRIREDNWPEVFNEKKGTIAKLNLGKEDELVETTHFVMKKMSDGK